jgi:hypothetical protein
MTFYSADPVRFGLTLSGTTTSLGANDPEVGTRVSAGDEDYVFVYNAGNSEIAPGNGAVLSAVTGYSVTVSSVAGDLLAGVCKNATLATGAYGWLVTKGFTAVEMDADSAASAGDILQLAADGTFEVQSGAVPHVGKAMEAASSGASGMAYISVV